MSTSLWAHNRHPEFIHFIPSLISSVAADTSAQVHGKWSVSVNDFFIYVRERPIRQIQWDKFREFVSAHHFRVWLFSGAWTGDRETDLSRWAASLRGLSQLREACDG